MSTASALRTISARIPIEDHEAFHEQALRHRMSANRWLGGLVKGALEAERERNRRVELDADGGDR